MLRNDAMQPYVTGLSIIGKKMPLDCTLSPASSFFKYACCRIDLAVFGGRL